jgi:anti-sigma factor RsiW
MSCAEIENQILDYLENKLPPAQCVAVETHLADCAYCRTFARQLRQLDAALAAGIKTPALSSGFDRRLQARIQALPAPWSEAQCAERKRRLQAEFEAGRARIEHGLFAWNSLREHLTWPVLAVLAGGLAWRFTLALTVHLRSQSLGGLDASLLPWLAAGAVVLTVGLAGTFPRPWRFLG